jgi:hypothetical protein
VHLRTHVTVYNGGPPLCLLFWNRSREPECGGKVQSTTIVGAMSRGQIRTAGATEETLIAQAQREGTPPGEVGRLLDELVRRRTGSGMRSSEARRTVAAALGRSVDFLNEHMALAHHEREEPDVARRIALLGGLKPGGRPAPSVGSSTLKLIWRLPADVRAKLLDRLESSPRKGLAYREVRRAIRDLTGAVPESELMVGEAPVLEEPRLTLSDAIPRLYAAFGEAEQSALPLTTVWESLLEDMTALGRRMTRFRDKFRDREFDARV